MTQLEILKYALYGVNEKMNREERLNDLYKQTHGHDSELYKRRIAKLQKKFDEITELMRTENNK